MILDVMSKIYGAGAYLRRIFYETGLIKKKYLPKPVISIGNLSTGGTGKTPLTIFTAKELQKKGLKVCVLSRGYKRRSKGTVVVSDGKNIFVGWQKAGDEPFLIASNNIPVIVSSSRYKAGLKALETMDVDVFILDDGFQHYQLHRDINILVIDATKPFWEDKLLPAGRLREPVSFYRYADIFVVNKISTIDKDKLMILEEKLSQFDKLFFFSSEHVDKLTDGIKTIDISILKGKNVGVFSGLGNNKQFFDLIRKLSKNLNCNIKKFISFPDHYDYSDLNLEDNVDLWITTEKDLIKIKKKENILALRYQLKLENRYIEHVLETIKNVRLK
ncbi:tetraacyldisaccharide 4'-kinase [Persephonella sp.]